MGHLRAKHGWKGSFEVELINPQSTMWISGRSVKIVHSRQEITSIITETKGKVGSKLIVTVQDIINSEMLKDWIPSAIYMQRADFPALDDGEFYLQDLVGFQVIDEHNKSLGSVKGFMETKSGEMLMLDNKEETLVPYLKTWIKKVDLASQTVTIFAFYEY